MDVLPSEILRNIFLHSLPCSYRRCDPPFSASISSPLHVSHVCRKWRSLALSYGELWSYLCLDYMAPKCRIKRKRIAEILATWISRSNKSPINYAFHCSLPTGSGTEDHQCAEHMITTLLSQQCRWKDVDFSWFGVDISSASGELEMSGMLSLTSLSLRVKIRKRAVIDISQSFRLRSLDLNGDYDLITGDGSLPSLKDLSRLEFRSLSGFSGDRAIRTCLSFLKCASFLTEFEANFLVDPLDSTPWSPTTAESSPIVLPHLRTLKLGHGAHPATIIGTLSLPSLEALYYSSSTADGTLLRFFQRSASPLAYLWLLGDCASTSEIIESLLLLPSLKYLRCSGARVNAHFFRALTTKGDYGESVDQNTVCPALGRLHLHQFWPAEDVNESLEACINMLKSRARLQESLKRVHLDAGGGQLISTDADDIDKHTMILRNCFENSEGVVIAGDPNFPFRLSSSSTRF